MTQLRCTIIALLIVPAIASSAYAIQQRNIEALMPRGGQRGTTVDILIQGMDLADPQEFVFYRPGIRAIDIETLPPLPRAVSLHHGAKVQEQLRCRFVIAPDCPVGEHPLRLRTATTLTTLATFWVSPFPTVEETERGGFRIEYDGGVTKIIPVTPKPGEASNDTLETAQPIPLNVSVSGEIKAKPTLDRDLYRVALQAGQRLSVEVDSVRLCDKAYAEQEYDLLARVLDTDGRELAMNDDSELHTQDPILSMIAPQSGNYFVEIRQRLFKGGRWNFYRAHIGTFARPLIAFPLGGPAGKTMSVQLIGDASGVTTDSVTLPSTTGDFDFFPGEAGQQPPSPLPLRVSNYLNVIEGQAVKALPVALNGFISAARQTDQYQFSVKKGDRYRVRVFARGMGSPLDPSIRIRHVDADQPEVEADDCLWPDRDQFAISRNLQRPALLDPSVIFEPQQDGEYLLEIRDMRGLGGERFAYRIEIEPVRNAVHTYSYGFANDAFEINRTMGFIVPQNNRWTINVLLGQGQGNQYRGDLKLVAQGLPDGIQMIAPRVKPGMSRVPVQFVAAPGVSQQTKLFRIEAQPADGQEPLVSTSQVYIPFINHSGGRAWNGVFLDRYALAVTQPAPFSIKLIPPEIPLSQSGELSLQVQVVRHGQFAGPVDIQPNWLPSGVAGGGAVTIDASESHAIYPLSASANASAGVFKITMNATTADNEWYYSGVGRIRVSSEFVNLTVAEPYIDVKFQPVAVRRGQTVRIVCQVEQRKPFSGAAVATIVGLPKGVTLSGPAPKVSPTDKQVEFEVVANSEALLGQYKQLTCELTFREGGQEIRQRSGRGILRVDPATK
jgi:hypothetical protein